MIANLLESNRMKTIEPKSRISSLLMRSASVTKRMAKSVVMAMKFAFVTSQKVCM